MSVRSKQASRSKSTSRSNTHNNPLRHLYGTARWQRARHAQLSESPLCVMCLCQDIVEPADTVDHVRPHKGDVELFWQPDNLQSLCKHHHDSVKQMQERGKRVVFWDVNGDAHEFG